MRRVPVNTDTQWLLPKNEACPCYMGMKRVHVNTDTQWLLPENESSSCLHKDTQRLWPGNEACPCLHKDTQWLLPENESSSCLHKDTQRLLPGNEACQCLHKDAQSITWEWSVSVFTQRHTEIATWEWSVSMFLHKDTQRLLPGNEACPCYLGMKRVYVNTKPHSDCYPRMKRVLFTQQHTSCYLGSKEYTWHPISPRASSNS